MRTEDFLLSHFDRTHRLLVLCVRLGCELNTQTVLPFTIGRRFAKKLQTEVAEDVIEY